MRSRSRISTTKSKTTYFESTRCTSNSSSVYLHSTPQTAATMAATSPKTYLDEPTLDIDIQNLSPSEKKDIIAYASSSYSAETDVTVVTPSSFNPTKTLLINARGIKLLRFPLPSSELEIPISTPEGAIVYVSTRAKKSSGNAVLTDAQGRECVTSEYFWGPGRDPAVKILGGENHGNGDVKVKGKWTSRSQEFVLPNGHTFTWRYSRERDPSTSNIKGKKRSFLVLDLAVASSPSPVDTGEKRAAEPRRLAQLVRNEESRTLGTKSCDAGNGGELVVDEAALKDGGLGEDFIVASCLLMLKKEIDRRLLKQRMVMMAAIAGGS
jgi:hypothetical protein